MTSLESKSNPISQPTEDLIVSENGNLTNTQDESESVQEIYTRLSEQYRNSVEDRNSTELEVAVNKLKMMQYERVWVNSISWDEDTSESEVDRAWSHYNRLLREQGRVEWELDALKVIKEQDVTYFRKIDGSDRTAYLIELNDRIGSTIADLEKKYPHFWIEANVSK